MYLDVETTSLQADIGMLIAIGFIYSNDESEVLFVDSPEEEKKIIQQAMEKLRKNKDEPIFIWHTGFDIPFIIARAIKNEVDASDVYDLKFVDLCKFVKENLKLASNKLDEVSKFLGIRKDLNLTGKNIQNLYLKAVKGDRKAREDIINHCLDDLRALKAIHEKLKVYIEKWMLNYKF